MENTQQTIMHHMVFFIAMINKIDCGAHYEARSAETTMMKDYIYELKALLIQEGVITEHGMKRLFDSLKKFGKQQQRHMRTLTSAECEKEKKRYDTQMQQYLAARGKQ